MTTRATYFFKQTDLEPDTWVYIHFDGYPSGAAQYFNAMKKDNRGGNATRFIRSNPLAEITHGHHDDTEYHYHIGTYHELQAFYRPYEGTWQRIFVGTIPEFIDQYMPKG